MRLLKLSSLYLGVFLSCSVIEDRTPCPCRLTLLLKNCSQDDMVDIFESNPSCSFLSHEAVRTGQINSRYIRSIPRGDVNVMAVCGLQKIQVEGSKLLIPVQEQSDSIFLYSRSICLNGDEAVDTAVLHKHFAVLNIRLEKPPADSGTYSVRIRGAVAGIDAISGRPLDGEFSFNPVAEDAEGTKYSVRVPRQGEGPMIMELVRNGEKMDDLDIGSKIVQSGYSWNEADLDDIWLSVDCARLFISLTIQEWEEGYNGKLKL